jgi:hypothetical protein
MHASLELRRGIGRVASDHHFFARMQWRPECFASQAVSNGSKNFLKIIGTTVSRYGGSGGSEKRD